MSGEFLSSDPPAASSQHGAARYKRGCRCVDCTDAHRLERAAVRARRKAAAATGWVPVPHGTDNAYRNYGCRCQTCKDGAHARYVAKRESTET